jgi:hypothetical protein
MNTQVNEIWANDIMTERQEPNFEGKIWTDYIYRWGCVITMIANIVQYFTNKKFTPQDMNKIAIYRRAYNYLQDNNCPEAKASYIVWDIIKDHFSTIFEIRLNLSPDRFKNSKNIMYGAKIFHEKTGGGHYINVMKNNNINNNNAFWCFDGEKNIIRSYNIEEIIKLHEFKYIGG